MIPKLRLRSIILSWQDAENRQPAAPPAKARVRDSVKTLDFRSRRNDPKRFMRFFQQDLRKS